MYENDPNYAPIEALVAALADAGVEHVCISPGSRSTPLTLTAAAEPRLRTWVHLDERSGAFFALGLAKATRRPVALICTSGTAAANFLPAAVEARHAHVPLVLLTADRPPELRDCGAGQAIDQIKLYGSHVKWFAEAATAKAGVDYFRALGRRAVAAAWNNPPGPVHLNFPLREPLVPRVTTGGRAKEPENGWAASGNQTDMPARPHAAAAPAPPADLVRSVAATLSKCRRGLFACGPLDAAPSCAAAVAALAKQLQLPVLADPLSQVRCGAHDTTLVVSRYDLMLRDAAFAERNAPDVVLRFGPLPTSKAFLQYLQRHRDCRQILIDPLAAWPDPTHLASEVLPCDAAVLCERLAAELAGCGGTDNAARSSWRNTWLEADRGVAEVVAARLAASDELFEPQIFTELAALLPDGAALYAGNSMPVRDLEAFWPAGSRRIRFLGNRGANGIDGLVSSGLGAAAGHDGRMVLVTGDLGFYHDLNGLLAAKRLGVRAVIVVINNNGGGIFSFLPQAELGEVFEPYFLTPHDLDFRGAAQMYGCAFARVSSRRRFRDAFAAALDADTTTVIEVPVDRERSVALHRELWAAAAASLAPSATAHTAGP